MLKCSKKSLLLVKFKEINIDHKTIKLGQWLIAQMVQKVPNPTSGTPRTLPRGHSRMTSCNRGQGGSTLYMKALLSKHFSVTQVGGGSENQKIQYT